MYTLLMQLLCPSLLMMTVTFHASITITVADSASSEQASLLISSSPAAPPESVEARIALRQHRESTVLNRFTFAGNVLEGNGDLVDHWIVMFCPGWHDKCQSLLPSYELLGVQWENKLNRDLMTSSVRFVKVDCATEKSLCASLGIDDYPSVVHYRNQQRVASWHGGSPGLVRFVKQELEGPKRRPGRNAPAQVHVKPSFPTCSADDTSMHQAESSDAKVEAFFPWGSGDFALMPYLLVAVSLLVCGIAWKAMHRNPCRWNKTEIRPSLAAPRCGSLPGQWASERRPIYL